MFRDFSNLESRIIKCLEEIKLWMLSNHLQLNTEKTKALVVRAKNNFDGQVIDTIKISNDESNGNIESSPMVKSLGILFDENLTFENQVNSVIQSCYINLRNLRAIGSKLSFSLKKQLIHCFIFSKMDYCNGLLVGLPGCLISKLQKVQNACIRFLYGKKIGKWDHITPFLKEAHFLPVRFRIDYKLALLTFKCINNIAPEYLKELLHIKEQSQSLPLRTTDDFFLLNVPKVLHLHRTERAFSFAAPNVWNKLPYCLRTCTNTNEFKKKLKTYYFS